MGHFRHHVMGNMGNLVKVLPRRAIEIIVVWLVIAVLIVLLQRVAFDAPKLWSVLRTLGWFGQ